MMTYEDARKKGLDACVKKIGIDFVKKYSDKACSAYGDREDFAFCFVGVSDRPDAYYDSQGLVLDGNGFSDWPYQACCNVWYNDGHIEFLDCKLPEEIQKIRT